LPRSIKETIMEYVVVGVLLACLLFGLSRCPVDHWDYEQLYPECVGRPNGGRDGSGMFM